MTGPGAPEAYRDILLPYLGRQVGRELVSACYAVERHGCLVALYDAYDKGALAWLEKVLAARTARHVFVVVHQPVVPFRARANWSLLIRPNQQAERARLLDLLGRHRAVVLVGHVHRYGAVVRHTGEGKFAQLALCSILSAKDQEPCEVREGVAQYGPALVELEPNFQPPTHAERRQLLEAERPFIRHFEYANTAGYACVRVEGHGIQAEIVNGVGQRPWRSLPLSDWLA